MTHEEDDEPLNVVEGFAEFIPYEWRFAEVGKHNGRVCLRKPWRQRLRDLRERKRLGFRFDD